MQKNSILNNLIKSLCVMPGIGHKTAQRIAIYMLQYNRKGGMQLANTLMQAMSKINQCSGCRIFTEETICKICSDNSRCMTNTICVVENHLDVYTIEKTCKFSGLYFVLMGQLSPLNNIGPKEIGLDILEKKLNLSRCKELILAITASIEGETTSSYIYDMCKKLNIQVSRISIGIPIGSSLSMIDENTLSHAITDRKQYISSV